MSKNTERDTSAGVGAMKFRKKPVVIEAEQWFPGKQVAGVREHTGCYDQFCPCGARRRETTGLIHTLEGVMVAEPGDWIITGVKGERYPCKPDIFASTYEAVA